MRKRTRYSLLLMLALVAALVGRGVAAQDGAARGRAAAARVGRDLYANLKPLRAATHFDRTPVTRSPDYQHFVDATGIDPERDLDAAAFALHRMDDPNGPNGPVAYSEVFEGRFDGARLARYLGHRHLARRTTPTTPSTPSRSRAASCGSRSWGTTPSPRPTCPRRSRSTPCWTAIARRRRRSPGSSLLAARYRDVPLLSSAWGIGHVGLPFSERGRISVFGLQLPLPEDTTFVASLRYGVGALHLRVEEIAPSEADAASSAEALNALLQLVRRSSPRWRRRASHPTLMLSASSPHRLKSSSIRSARC
jgi:hypothetical protein